MRTLDLFSGIGGFSLGLERAGFKTVAFCEIDPWCRRLLAKHWPGLPIYEDVRHLDAARLRADGIDRIDAICGGFPCQDISTAGKGAGLEGERSGLWREYARLVGELRPRHVIVENVGALRGRGLAAVLGDLATLGYDAEWHAIPAAAVGAPHLRDRVWIVAFNADGDDGRSWRAWRLDPATAGKREPIGALPQPAATDADRQRLRLDQQRPATGRHDLQDGGQAQPIDDGAPGPDPDADGERRERRRLAQHGDQQRSPGLEPDGLGARGRWGGPPAAEAAGRGPSELRGLFGPLARALAAASTPWERTTEPPLRRMDDELPAGVDGPRRARLIRTQDRERTKALGNAVVPLIPELIGRALLEVHS